MQTPSPAVSTRRGTPGLDIFKLAGQSISGFFPSFKTGDPRRIRQPFTSHLEERLATYLEYHPHVRCYQRGDASEAFALARHMHTPLGTPYRIPYLYEGKAHDYLPDFVGTLTDGGLLIAEAGRTSEKQKAQAVAKAMAAQRLAQLKGGVYWLGTEEVLSLRRHYNLLYLHARRQAFATYPEIAATLLAHWPWGEMASVSELVRLFGPRWSEQEVEAAVWKLMGDAAAEGRLLVDLMEVELSLSTPFSLLDPSLPPILPDPLPSSLEAAADDSTPLVEDAPPDDRPLARHSTIPGPTFDASTLHDADLEARFHRNLAAVSARLAGTPRDDKWRKNMGCIPLAWHAWSNAWPNLGNSPVCLMPPTIATGPCARNFSSCCANSTPIPCVQASWRSTRMSSSSTSLTSSANRSRGAS